MAVGAPACRRDGRDEDERSEQLLSRLLGKHSDIVGFYNVARKRKALIDSGREKQVVFVGHDVRKLLLEA